jgi:hypothetical protein
MPSTSLKLPLKPKVITDMNDTAGIDLLLEEELIHLPTGRH